MQNQQAAFTDWMSFLLSNLMEDHGANQLQSGSPKHKYLKPFISMDKIKWQKMILVYFGMSFVIH